MKLLLKEVTRPSRCLLFVCGSLLRVLVSMCIVWPHCWNSWSRQHRYTHSHIYPSPPSSIAAREWSHEWVAVRPELLYMASSFCIPLVLLEILSLSPALSSFLITILVVLHGVLASGLWSTAAACLTGGAIFYLIHQHTSCGAVYTCGYRAKLRRKYGLPEEPCNDCCTDCFCLPCSLAQQTRELQNHGVTPYLGIIQSSS